MQIRARVELGMGSERGLLPVAGRARPRWLPQRGGTVGPTGVMMEVVGGVPGAMSCTMQVREVRPAMAVMMAIERLAGG